MPYQNLNPTNHKEEMDEHIFVCGSDINRTLYVHATNLPKETDRALILKIFQPFGNTRKIYIHPDLTFCKIYFKSPEVAAKAVVLNEQPPYYMKLTVESEYLNISKNKLNTSLISESSSNMSCEEECYGYTGPVYYNIHGIAITTLSADDGSVYVGLDDVKQIGFALFESDSIPQNINFTKQMLDEFKLYLNMKARKYIHRMKCDIPESTVNEVKKEIINKYVSNGAIPKHTPRQRDSSISSNWSKSSLIEGKTNKSGTRNQSEEQKPLRRPTHNSTNDKLNNRQGFDDSFKAKVNKEQNVKEIPTPKMQNKKNFKQSQVKSPELPLNKHVQENYIPFLDDRKNLNQSELKRIELPLNKPVQVTVSFVENQDRCWVYKTADNEKLEKLLYETNFEATKQPVIKAAVGQICATTFCGAWYRAVIEEITPAVKVQFIDFGNFNNEEVKNLRELPEKIIGEPALAVKLNFATRPKTKLADDVNLKIIAIKKYDDGSYQVEEVSERISPPNLMNAVPAGKMIINNLDDKSDDSKISKSQSLNGFSPKSMIKPVEIESPRSNSARGITNDSAKKQTEKSKGVSQLTLKEKLKKMTHPKKEIRDRNPSRKSVVDLFENTSGVLQYVDRLGDDSCLVFIFPEQFLQEVEILEQIQFDDKSAVDFIGKVSDTVSVYKEDSDNYVRGTIINVKNNDYVVALIDYGTIISTDKANLLEKRFVDIPEFSCVCSGNIEYINLLETNVETEFSTNEKNKVEISVNDVLCNIDCKRWDPFLTSKLAKDPNEFVLFTKRPGVKDVKDGERVLVVTLNDGKLLVRNKETYDLLSTINKAISMYEASSLPQTPIVNQLVLAPHDTQPNICRGIVTSINNNYAVIEFIDHGFTDMVPLKNLKSINELLATECCCLIPISLKGFEDGNFSVEGIEYIELYSKQSKKLLTKKYSDNVFDLFTLDANDTVGLSIKLRNLTARDDVRLKYKSLPKEDIKAGTIENLLCVSFESDNESIAFLTNNGVKDHLIKLNDQIMECIASDKDAYVPEVDELILAKFEEEWFRAKVDNINSALELYSVYFVDYGNTAQIPSDDIRKMPEDFIKIPALAVIGRLTEIVNNPTKSKDILDIVKNEMTVGESYHVKFIGRLGDNLYEISIPDLSPHMQQLLAF